MKNKIILKNLDFPLFETTEEEKELLRKCEIHFISNKDDIFLCCVIPIIKFNKEVKQNLKDKIENYLGDNGKSLGNILNLYANDLGGESATILRRYWITLLLNYRKPESDS